jgi:hypothetical protein
VTSAHGCKVVSLVRGISSRVFWDVTQNWYRYDGMKLHGVISRSTVSLIPPRGPQISHRAKVLDSTTLYNIRLRDIHEVLLGKLIVAQMCKNFHEFYEIRRLITVFTKALRTGPYPEPDETCPHPHTRHVSLVQILHLKLRMLCSLPITRGIFTAHLILLDLTARLISDKDYKLWTETSLVLLQQLAELCNYWFQLNTRTSTSQQS